MWVNRRLLREMDWKLDDLQDRLLRMEIRQMATWAEVKADLVEYKDATQAMRAAFAAVVKKLDDLVAGSKDGEFVPVAELTALKEELDRETAAVVVATLEGTRGEPTEEEAHAAGM
jgi:vacuolar-type H+-ATPase subunit I/STV1